MNLKSREVRILAMDLRSRRFGFAVFEGPKRLLDWGVGIHPLGSSAGAAAARKRIAFLLKLFLPSVIVVRRVRLKNARNSANVRSILEPIRREASARSIPVRLMKTAEVRRAFRLSHAKTKHEIVSALVQIFPELLWKLPPKRKVWQSEHYRMAMFDAIALGFAYWQRNGARDPSE